MSIVRPFAGLRPPADKVEKVASLPYDVVSTEEARKLAEGSSLSFFHVSRPEIDFPPTTDPHTGAVYDLGRKCFERFRADGILSADDRACFYLYRQKMGSHVQTGLVACVSVDEYQSGLIKKHELTRKDKEDDRTQHVDVLDANDEPVFLTYRSSKIIDALVVRLSERPPAYDFTSADGIRHTFWVVRGRGDVALITRVFRDVPALYVADGHHRSAAAARVRDRRKGRATNHTGQEEYNFFLAVLFPHDQMQILDYNRVVKDLNGLWKEAFIKSVEEKFAVKTSATKKPTKAHEFGLYLEGSWYLLTAKDGTFDAADPVASLDVSILQENLLARVLGIQDPRVDKRIDFVGGIRGTEELERMVNDGRARAAFSMFPTGIDQLMAIADAGKIMPPKSTWFEPKLRSGLVVHAF